MTPIGLDALAAPRPFPLGTIVSVAEPFALATGIPRKPGQLIDYEPGIGQMTLAVVAIDGVMLRVPSGEVEVVS